MNKFTLLLVIVATLSGCSPMKKLQNIENKDPELFNTVIKDSAGKFHNKHHVDSSTFNIASHQTATSSYINSNDADYLKWLSKQPHRKLTIITHSGFLTNTLTIDSSGIKTTSSTDSAKVVKVTTKDTAIDTNYKTKLIEVPKEIEKTHWYDWFLRPLGILFLLLIIAAFVWALLSIKKKL